MTIQNPINSSDLITLDYRNSNLTDIPESRISGSEYILLKIKGIGSYSDGIEIIEALKGKATLIFLGFNRCTDAMIASSLGMDCGIELQPDEDFEESLFELANYYFYSPRSHGNIEPFHSMTESYSQVRRISPSIMYGELPSKHLWQPKLETFTACAVCPAFRICSGFFHNQETSGCRDFMSELLINIERKKEHQYL